MKTSCIAHPARDPLILIRQWQLKFCEGNYVAAALMSYFEYWHNIKLSMKSQASSANDAAEKHGDDRTQDESLWQRHSNDELEAGIMGMAKRDKIRDALDYLENTKKVITTGRNPNPRYSFDATKHYLFRPEVANAWLRSNSPSAENRTSNDDLSQMGKYSENAPAENRQPSAENRQPSAINRSPSAENRTAIEEIPLEIHLEIIGESGGLPPLSETAKGPETAAEADKPPEHSLYAIWQHVIEEVSVAEPTLTKSLEGSTLERSEQGGQLTYRVEGVDPRFAEWVKQQSVQRIKRTLGSFIKVPVRLFELEVIARMSV